MKTHFFFWLSLLFVLSGETCLSAQPVATDSLENIFSRLQRYTPLHVVIETNLKPLKQDRKSGEWQPAVFRIMDGDNVAFEQQVKVTARGNMRKKICQFPPIKIRFYDEKPEDDSLADINELKLVISCRNTTDDDQLVLRENLAYALYNRLTDESFRVKSAVVQFKTPGRNKVSQESKAFFIESERELASRLGGRPLKPRLISPNVMDSMSYARMCLFQYMIGNTDWGAYTRHNMKIIALGSHHIIAVPYDFDYAGMVDADYAAPAPDVPIKHVRERYYLGLCESPALYESVFQEFLAHKREILNLCDAYPDLSYASKRDIRAYLEDFFTVLENPNKARKEIIEHCDLRIKKE